MLQDDITCSKVPQLCIPLPFQNLGHYLGDHHVVFEDLEVSIVNLTVTKLVYCKRIFATVKSRMMATKAINENVVCIC